MRPLVWPSHVHKTPLQIRASSLFYLLHVLYQKHQLFIDIERENILSVLDCVSFIEIVSLIYDIRMTRTFEYQAQQSGLWAYYSILLEF